MKLVKFFALAVAALAVSCAPEENKVNTPDFELTESTIYCDVTAGEWENCNVWAWTEGGDNYTQSGNWPGDAGMSMGFQSRFPPAMSHWGKSLHISDFLTCKVGRKSALTYYED